jgi:hypothetical protein
MKLLIDTEWATFIADLPEEKQLEFFWAIFDYGNKECSLKCWEKIQPILEKGKIGYFNRLNNLKQYKTESESESITESVSESEPEREYKYKNINININKNTNKGGMGGNNQIKNKQKVNNLLQSFGNSFKPVDAVVGIFEQPDGSSREGIKINNPRLMRFVRQRFDAGIIRKVSDWAIDHNQRGHTYNANTLLKLLCKFQRDAEPTINYNFVQSEWLGFENESV